MKTHNKVLIFDIETMPILANVWDIWQQNVPLNQIFKDWSVLSWSAKWYGEKEIMYADTRANRDLRDDRQILKGIWKLLDEADVVITQNGISFDTKKLNARFIIHGMKPPSPYRHIDTKRLAKKHFAFTSNRLEYMTDKLCAKYKKSKHRKYPGFELWKACEAGDLKAFKEMEAYNKMDVLSLEELYTKLQPWDNTVNFMSTERTFKCNCGSRHFQSKGYRVTQAGRYKRYICQKCGAPYIEKTLIKNQHKMKAESR